MATVKSKVEIVLTLNAAEASVIATALSDLIDWGYGPSGRIAESLSAILNKTPNVRLRSSVYDESTGMFKMAAGDGE